MNSLRSSFVHIVINFRSWRLKSLESLVQLSQQEMANKFASYLASVDDKWFDFGTPSMGHGQGDGWVKRVTVFLLILQLQTIQVSLSLHYKIDGFSGRFLPISSFFCLLVIPWSHSSTDERWWWCLPLKGATDTRSTQQTRCCILSNSNLQLVHILTTTETRAL